MKEHLNSKERVASGLRALPTTKTAFASTQAAWRFYKNQKVTLKKLVEPLIQIGREATKESCKEYALIVHDWSDLTYPKHSNKQDRVEISHKKNLGYELQTALLISDMNGNPLTMLYEQLRSADGIYSSRSERMLRDRSKLDRLHPTMKFIDKLELGKPTVHIIDREADSVGHYRQWMSQKRKFIVRADDCRRVLHLDKSKLISEIVEEQTKSGTFVYNQEVEHKGKRLKQYISETNVILDRPARQHRTRNGNNKWVNIKGKAIKLRLIFSQLRDEDGAVVVQWLLLTNLTTSISKEYIVKWYQWRWQIESFFKLLKSSGHNLEQWLQENAEAIAKRLLVVAMSCVVVWQLARSNETEAIEVRQLLVRISGRQMKYNKPFTEPAILAGLWSLLSTLELLEQFEVADLKRFLKIALPDHLISDSS